MYDAKIQHFLQTENTIKRFFFYKVLKNTDK